MHPKNGRRYAPRHLCQKAEAGRCAHKNPAEAPGAQECVAEGNPPVGGEDKSGGWLDLGGSRALSRRDILTIARRFNAGDDAYGLHKSRRDG